MLAKNKKIKVLEAGDGQEALSFLKSEEIDILLLDINMPKMNGLETLMIIWLIITKNYDSASYIFHYVPKDDFMNDVSTQLHKMGMNGFEHLDTNVNDMSMIVRDFLPNAGRYDILIFDVDAFTQDVSALARMFKVLNPKIKLISYVNKQHTQHYERF